MMVPEMGNQTLIAISPMPSGEKPVTCTASGWHGTGGFPTAGCQMSMMEREGKGAERSSPTIAPV